MLISSLRQHMHTPMFFPWLADILGLVPRIMVARGRGWRTGGAKAPMANREDGEGEGGKSSIQ